MTVASLRIFGPLPFGLVPMLIGILVVVACSVGAAQPGPTELRGTVVSTMNGRPVAEARIDIATAAPKRGKGIFCPSCYLDCAKHASSDTDGKFQFTALNPTLRFSLVATAPGFRTVRTNLMDPAQGAVTLRMEPLQGNLDPRRMVTGVVLHDGAAVAGALVEPVGAETKERRWFGAVDVAPEVTDARGRFSMLLPDEYRAIDVEVAGHGFCKAKVTQLLAGSEHTISVHAGARVIGQILHNGQPVVDADVAVVQVDRRFAVDKVFVAAIGDVTDRRGTFDLRCLPPNQKYCIYSVVGEAKRGANPLVITSKLFSAPATNETRDLGALEAVQPLSIRGVVQGVDDQPLPQGLQLSLGRERAWDLVSASVDEDGAFEFLGLPPETYTVRLADKRLELDSSRLTYQQLRGESFGLYLERSIQQLVVPVKEKP